VQKHLHLSPLKSGSVTGKGPRYCPSIDRKIINFPDRERHPVFVEPEGARTHEMYLQGLTTSLPVFVQEKLIQATPGLEQARLVRPGYAVEYDYLPPEQLTAWLETKAVHGLFSAGQINGTSGYEEAAAQGLMAGINASLYCVGQEPFILRRDQAYIGVLIDDLVTKEVDEPYRMFTSRAEYRLLLRSDNAAERLSAAGHELGLLTDEQLASVESASRQVQELQAMLETAVLKPGDALNWELATIDSAPLGEGQSAAQLLKRPGVTVSLLARFLDARNAERLKHASPEVLEQIAIRAQYDGYIERQLAEIRRHRTTEGLAVPPGFDYDAVEGITFEAKQKLRHVRPATLGQASRIAGVSPADISVLMLRLHRLRRNEETTRLSQPAGVRASGASRP
jgi:tRNA uridine 5-carboxymethylaminomethyl modification enzyme